MSLFKVALLQMTSAGTKEEKSAQGRGVLQKCEGYGGRIWLCFLRCGTTATVFPMTWRLWKGIQRTRTACLSILFKELAAELEMAIAVTYLEKYKPLPRNTVTVLTGTAEMSLHMRKCIPAILI